ncbi:NACHT domain-containing protein [Micromonospora wenchangensis]|uniref:NACHT domain-containing protein n=1 Tax=Micromonospora wenchangensis TaxID=1185415 RepID=UPI003D706C8A
MERAAAWLETGDQIASIVGATAGVLALVFAVRAELRTRLPWALLTLCVALFTVAFVPAASSWVTESSAWAAALVGAIALVVAVRRRRTTSPPAVDPQIMALLRRLRTDDARHRYRFFVGWSAPALSDIYIRQRPAIGGPDAGRHQALVSVDDLLTSHGHGLLLGGAGSGKSTLAAVAVAAVAERALSTGELKSLAVSVTAADMVGRSLPDALSLSCGRDLGVNVQAALFADPPVPGGRWNVIVDGVDEVINAHDRSRLIWELRSLLHNGDDTHRLLVTSRPLPDAELAALRSFRVTEYELRPFDRADLTDFAQRWFAARLPHDPDAAARRSALFLTRVTGARLGPVARVPLLATIAAIVFEQADGGALPTSRAHLYARFVEHLLDGRHELSETRATLVEALQARSRDGLAIATWLKDDFYGVVAAMLDAVGAARVTEPDADLCGVALAWVDAHAPYHLTDTLPDARRQVDDLLRSTGLLGMRHGRLAFLHQSFAEFLCARAEEGSFDAERWRTMAANPAARSLAAFTAARRWDADTLVRSLVTDEGLITAADMIADGVPVHERTRVVVLDRLFEHLGFDTPAAPEALRVLRELSVDPDVLRRLITMGGDGKVSQWTRVVLADVVIDVDRAAGVSQLRTAATHFDAEPAAWAAEALRARGLQVDARIDITPTRDRGALGGLGRQALSQRASNRDFSDVQRLAAAERLAYDGELTPLRALVQEAGVDRLAQFAGAKVLADLGDLRPLLAMTEWDDETADTQSAWLQYVAAIDIFDRDRDRGVPILRAVFNRHEASPRTYGCAARLADAGSTAELEVLAAADESFWREPDHRKPWPQSRAVGALLARAAARRLAGEIRTAGRARCGSPARRTLDAATRRARRFGDPEALERVIADRAMPARFRVAAATSLAMLFGPAADEPLRQLERWGDLHFETVAGIPALPSENVSLSVPAVPGRSSALCAAVAADPGTPRSLRAALTLLAPSGSSADRLARVADDPAMGFRIRLEAINAMVRSNPEVVRHSLATLLHERDVHYPLIWFMLLRIVLGWNLDMNRLGWSEFRTIAHRIDAIRDTRFPAWRIAATVLTSRPVLDRAAGPH